MSYYYFQRKQGNENTSYILNRENKVSIKNKEITNLFKDVQQTIQCA